MTSTLSMTSSGKGWSRRLLALGGAPDEAAALAARLKAGMAAQIDRDRLVAALQRVIAALSAEPPPTTMREVAAQRRDAKRIAREAIAKARGEVSAEQN